LGKVPEKLPWNLVARAGRRQQRAGPRRVFGFLH
jgi:hypothetical protein